MTSPDTRAEMRLPSRDIREDLPFYTGTLGMRLEQIFPADDPAVAVVSGHGLRLRLERGAPDAPGTLRILTPEPDVFAGGARRLVAPGGTVVEIDHADPPLLLPDTEHAFSVRRLSDSAPWVIGRAGMHYRDLVPSRLGGAIIASHIRIPDGGPVPDMVHYHTIGFQLIFCHRGWVDLVYEDQGPPFRLGAGDCVIQPPEIRHRVLFASDNIEVVEIGVPAEHVTTIDHEMELPNGPARPERRFQGQSFVLHREEGAAWTPFRLPGFEARETGIAEGTGGVAGVQVARPTSLPEGGSWTRHDADILFGFVREGSARLEAEGEGLHDIAQGDAFTIPPGLKSRLFDASADFELLEVALPGRFETVSAG
ncbi:MAG: cupin [Rhodobacteraceae bacterium]|nr:cupin [Paracoccaceae bacterium]